MFASFQIFILVVVIQRISGLRGLRGIYGLRGITTFRGVAFSRFCSPLAGPSAAELLIAQLIAERQEVSKLTALMLF